MSTRKQIGGLSKAGSKNAKTGQQTHKIVARSVAIGGFVFTKRGQARKRAATALKSTYMQDRKFVLGEYRRIFGSESDPKAWFQTERIDAFAGRTPHEVVSDGYVSRMIDYLRGLEAGAYQ